MTVFSFLRQNARLHLTLYPLVKQGSGLTILFCELVSSWKLKKMAQRGLPQSKEALLKSYSARLKDDVKSLLENFEGRL